MILKGSKEYVSLNDNEQVKVLTSFSTLKIKSAGLMSPRLRSLTEEEQRDKCIDRANTDLTWATGIYYVGLAACICIIESGPGCLLCLASVNVIFANECRKIDRDLEDCINSIQ